MARFICLALLCFFAINAAAGGGNDDERFRRWRRHLRHSAIAVDPNLSHRAIALALSSAIQNHNLDGVAKILTAATDEVLKDILGHVYELPEHKGIAPASALGLAVICGNAQAVHAILDVVARKPTLASVVFANDCHGQTPMNMAVYLDVSSVVFEFVAFAALHPLFAPVMEAPNKLGHSPRETAIHNGRRELLAKLNIPVIPSVVAMFLVATSLWYQ